MLLIFIVILGGHFGLQAIQDRRLADLEADEQTLNSQIASVLAATEAATYHEIGEILPYLPAAYQPMAIGEDLEFVRNLSQMAPDDELEYVLTSDVSSPFEEPLASTIRFVRIDLTLRLAEAGDAMAYLDQLMEQDRLFYVQFVSVDLLDDGEATVQMIIYTFYNDVVL